MKPGPKAVLVLVILLCLALNLFSRSLSQYHLGIVIEIGINIILAVSLNLINGYTGQFSLGHAGFMAVGGYTAAYLTIQTSPKILIGLTGIASVAATSALFVGALLVGALVAAIVGLLVGLPSLRLKGDYLAIVTLGFGEIIRVIFQNMEAVGAARGLKGIPLYTNFFWAFALAAITVYVVVTLVHSTYGRGFIAVHDDELAAAAMGLNPTRYKVVAFVIGAFFAGMAGGLYAHFNQFLSPTGFDFMRSIEIVVMVILGGMGNTTGVIIAAILLTLLPQALREHAGDYRMIIYSLLIIILMLTRPQGLFSGLRRHRRRPV